MTESTRRGVTNPMMRLRCCDGCENCAKWRYRRTSKR